MNLLKSEWDTKTMRQRCGHHPRHKCADCILRLNLPTIPETKPKWSHWPVTVWHACCSRLPLRCKCWGYEGGHQGPPDNPPSAKKSSQRTESNRSERRHIVQIIYGWYSVHLKLRWNTGSFPTCRGISLSSVARSMCTVFHPDLRFSVLSRAYT